MLESVGSEDFDLRIWDGDCVYNLGLPGVSIIPSFPAKPYTLNPTPQTLPPNNTPPPLNHKPYTPNGSHDFLYLFGFICHTFLALVIGKAPKALRWLSLARKIPRTLHAPASQGAKNFRRSLIPSRIWRLLQVLVLRCAANSARVLVFRGRSTQQCSNAPKRGRDLPIPPHTSAPGSKIRSKILRTLHTHQRLALPRTNKLDMVVESEQNSEAASRRVPFLSFFPSFPGPFFLSCLISFSRLSLILLYMCLSFVLYPFYNSLCVCFVLSFFTVLFLSLSIVYFCLSFCSSIFLSVFLSCCLPFCLSHFLLSCSVSFFLDSVFLLFRSFFISLFLSVFLSVCLSCFIFVCRSLVIFFSACVLSSFVVSIFLSPFSSLNAEPLKTLKKKKYRKLDAKLRKITTLPPPPPTAQMDWRQGSITMETDTEVPPERRFLSASCKTASCSPGS